jgi:hypothetical protein
MGIIDIDKKATPKTSLSGSITQLRKRMLENTIPIYFIDWCLFSAIGMEEHIGNIQFICAIDTFDGLHPNIFVPKDFEYDHSLTCEQTLLALLTNEEVIAHIKSQGPGKMLTWLLDDKIEQLVAELGLEICLPPHAIRHQWDNKANTNRLAERAGVPCVPYILSPIENYRHLRSISLDLGEHLVVQMPHGVGGETTFFISNEDDFNCHSVNITNGEEMKIMTRINCSGASLEACITKHGVVVTPLLFELIGIPEINIYKGGWSGDEFLPNAFPIHIIESAKEYAVKMGEALRQVGYNGYFQPDMLIDEDNKTLYLGEMNLRFSGFTPLINNTNLAHQDIPLLILHLAEWLKIDYQLNTTELNNHWTDQSQLKPLSFLHVKNVLDSLAKPIRSGIYRMETDGSVVFDRPAINPNALVGEQEIFWMGSAGRDSKIEKGDEIGALFVRGRVTIDGKHLTEKAKVWLKGLGLPTLPS